MPFPNHSATNPPSGGPAGSNQGKRRYVNSKDQGSTDVIVRAFFQTQQVGHTVVLILGEYPHIHHIL
jgi:hypothetical protein